MIGMATNRQALLVGQAGLLDVDVDIAHGSYDPHGIMHQPAGVGVGNETIAGLQTTGDGTNAGNVSAASRRP